MLREIRLLTFRRLQLCLRNPTFLFMGVGAPLIYLALFTPLLKNLNLAQLSGTKNILMLFVPGMLPIIAFSTGLFTGFSIIDEIRSDIVERFRVAPISRFSILAGYVLFDVFSVFFQSILFVLIAVPFGFQANFTGIFILFLLLLLLTVITSSLGNALGIFLKSEDRYSPIVYGINLPILLLSGTLLPMWLAPKWLKILAYFNPVFYVVNASRSLVFEDFTSNSVLYAFAILTPLAIGTLLLATSAFKKFIN